MDEKPAPSIRDLYPYLNDEELAEAGENLERYLALVLRIFERMESEVSSEAAPLTPEMGTLPCIPPRPDSSS